MTCFLEVTQSFEHYLRLTNTLSFGALHSLLDHRNQTLAREARQYLNSRGSV